MQDSGVEWIGEIPEGWSTKRLKFLCRITTGDKDTQDSEKEGVYKFYVRSPIIEHSNSWTFEGEGILMAGDGAGAGRIGEKTPYTWKFQPFALQPVEKLDRVFRYFCSLPDSNNYYRTGDGQREKRTVGQGRDRTLSRHSNTAVVHIFPLKCNGMVFKCRFSASVLCIVYDTCGCFYVHLCKIRAV